MEKFKGTGTGMIGGLFDIAENSKSLPPELLIRSLKRHADLVPAEIEKHHGVTLQFIGDSVLAFWHPETHPLHAQRAFDASNSILTALAGLKPVSFPMAIALGTGEMGGDYFGTKKQFQIVGKAMATADRLFNFKRPERSTILFSQDTTRLIKTPASTRKEGLIKRDGLAALDVYTYCPAA